MRRKKESEPSRENSKKSERRPKNFLRRAVRRGEGPREKAAQDFVTPAAGRFRHTMSIPARPKATFRSSCSVEGLQEFKVTLEFACTAFVTPPLADTAVLRIADSVLPARGSQIPR